MSIFEEYIAFKNFLNKISRPQIDNVFIFFPENNVLYFMQLVSWRVWYFTQSVFLGDNMH